MPHISIKQFLSLGLVTVMVTLQLAAPAQAATEQDILAATEEGVGYLTDNQNSDGSIPDFSNTSEWAVIALEARGQNAAEIDSGSGISAVDFLAANPPSSASSATDVERKILAIAAIGEDTTNFGGVDYNALLAARHTDSQIGDMTLLNDDIFGVIAVDAAGDTSLNAVAQDGLDYFLAHQQSDGGFSYSANTCPLYCGSESNTTAAAIIAIVSAENLNLTNANLVAAKTSATTYLLSTIQTDGGFGYDIYSPSDGSSTAWGLMALNVLQDLTYQNQAIAAQNWLLANQNPDGGFSFGAYGYNSSDIYTTSHAVLALLGTSWLLRPTPLRATPSSPSIPAPSTATSAATKTSLDPVIATAAVKPKPSTTTKREPTVIAQPTSEVKSASQTKPLSSLEQIVPAIQESVAQSKTNYALYAILVLPAAAVGWFVLQSKKQEA